MLFNYNPHVFLITMRVQQLDLCFKFLRSLKSLVLVAFSWTRKFLHMDINFFDTVWLGLEHKELCSFWVPNSHEYRLYPSLFQCFGKFLTTEQLYHFSKVDGWSHRDHMNMEETDREHLRLIIMIYNGCPYQLLYRFTYHSRNRSHSDFVPTSINESWSKILSRSGGLFFNFHRRFFLLSSILDESVNVMLGPVFRCRDFEYVGYAE